MVSVEEFPDDPPSLAVFHTDGTYEDTDADGSRGLGAWEATGASSANLTVVSMSPTGDGGLAPLVTIRAAVAASADGQSFSADFTIEPMADGTLTGEFGPGHATGTRIAVEPMGTPVGSLDQLVATTTTTSTTTAPATTAPPPPSNLPPARPAGDPFAAWPYGEFWNVPQLGSEPVRGSGCGANGQLGDVIPDGLWAGYVSYDGGTDTFWIDVLCIYYGQSAQQVLAGGSATIVNDEPDYLIVNNSERRRQAANDTQVVFISDDTGNGCRPAGAELSNPGQSHITGFTEGTYFYPNLQAWVRIDGGAVTWFVYGCDTGFPFGG
jgi:hypothetical protein